jgi:hypothetical protein
LARESDKTSGQYHVMPPLWKVDILAERLVRELQKEIGMAQSFFHEGSVLVLVFGILDTWVNGKLTPPVGWFIVLVSFGSYVAALLTEWGAFCVLRVWRFQYCSCKGKGSEIYAIHLFRSSRDWGFPRDCDCWHR